MSDSADSSPPVHNNFGLIIGLDAACFVVSAVFISLRFYVRHSIVKKITLDDWLLLVAVVFFLVQLILDATSWIYLAADGIVDGWAMSDLTGTICVVPYLLSEAFTRAAYAVFYLRVIPPQLDLRWHRYLIVFAATVYALYQTAFAFVELFSCGSPANLVYLGTLDSHPDVKCLGNALNVLFDISYYFDAIGDWLMALIPMVVVLRSTMSTRTKLSVAFILLLGCLAGLLAVCVIVLSSGAGWDASNTADQNPAILIDVLATLETQVAIVCLCLAAMKPLVRKHLFNNERTPDPRDLRNVWSKYSPAPPPAAVLMGNHSPGSRPFTPAKDMYGMPVGLGTTCTVYEVRVPSEGEERLV